MFISAWRVVFKVSSGTQVPGYSDIASLYMSSASFNEGMDSAMNDFSAGSEVYKSKIVDEWHTTQTINAVRALLFSCVVIIYKYKAPLLYSLQCFVFRIFPFRKGLLLVYTHIKNQNMIIY